MNLRSLSTSQLESLREIARYGMNQAAGALSQLLGQSVQIRVPSVQLGRLKGVPEFIMGPPDRILAIYLKLLGDAQGDLLFLLPEQSARTLICQLLRQDPPPEFDDPLARSTLLEIGNILASAFLAALDNLLKMSLIPSIPELQILGADELLERLSTEGEPHREMLLLETAFVLPGKSDYGCLGYFCLRPATASLPALLQAARQADERNQG